MAGLGSAKKSGGVYLSVAGGFIWDRKADESDPNYATQEYTKADGEKNTRKGAQYGDILGTVTNVRFNVHKDFGQNINVHFDLGMDEDYILSVSTNNQNAQHLMKALLKMDFSKELYVKPYDFVDKVKNKPVRGISFKQGGEKLDLKIDDLPMKPAAWFAENAGTNKIRRFFEDLAEWLVAEIEEKVSPRFAEMNDKSKGDDSAPAKKSAPKAETTEAPKVTPLKMKKAIRAFIAENYEGQEMPSTLKGAELVKWYNLAIAEEELPFATETPSNDADEVSAEDLDAELDGMLPEA